MSLIKCIECGKDFSDKASCCPNCGCPTDFVLQGIKKNEEKNRIEQEAKKKEEQYEQEVINKKKLRQKEENERKQREFEEQRKIKYEKITAHYHDVVMQFPLFGEAVEVTKGMRNRILYRTSYVNSKSKYIGQYKNKIQTINNLKDVMGFGIQKLWTCFNDFVDEECSLLSQYGIKDIDSIISEIGKKGEELAEEEIENVLGDFLHDVRFMQGPSFEDPELYSKELYRIFNKYPIKHMLLSCLENIINILHESYACILENHGVYVNWVPEGIENAFTQYLNYKEEYLNLKLPLTDFRKYIVQMLSIDTDNREYYYDIVQLNIIGGEKDNFVHLCDFLGYKEVYEGYVFEKCSTYIFEIEQAKDYLYGRGIKRNASRAVNLIEKNSCNIDNNISLLRDVLDAYKEIGDNTKIKETLLKLCNLGDKLSAKQLFNDILKDAEISEQVQIYHSIEPAFRNDNLSDIYNQIYNQILCRVADKDDQIRYFNTLGHPQNNKALFYIASLYEDSESQELWKKASDYYAEVAKSNDTLGVIKTFVILENGIIDGPYNCKSILMKQEIWEEYSTIIYALNKLSMSGNLYAKFLYATYLVMNYLRDKESIPLEVSCSDEDYLKIFKLYYDILKQSDQWMAKNKENDKNIENIINMKKEEIVNSSAEFVLSFPMKITKDTENTDAIQRIVKQLPDSETQKEIAGKIQTQLGLNVRILPVVKNMKQRKDDNVLLEIYCGEVNNVVQYCALSKDGALFTGKEVDYFLNDLYDVFDKGDIELSAASNSLLKKYQSKALYKGCNFYFSKYGKKTHGVVLLRNKIVFEIQNNNIYGDSYILNYVGECVLDEENKQIVFYDIRGLKFDSFYKFLREYNPKEYIAKSDSRFTEKTVCPYCNSVLDSDMDYCYKCGKKNDTKESVLQVDEKYFELLIGLIINEDLVSLRKAVGGNANICVQYGDGRIDWLINRAIVSHASVNTIKELLNLGANSNSVRDVKYDNGKGKNSALTDAIKCAKGQEIVDLLISRGADTSFHSIREDNTSEYSSMLNLAIAYSKNYSVVKTIWDNSDKSRSNLVRYVYERNDVSRFICYSPLFDAVISGNLECVKLLLDNGYDANSILIDTFQEAREDKCVLDASVLWGNAEMVDLLLEYGANPNGFRKNYYADREVVTSTLADAMILNDDKKIASLLKAGARLEGYIQEENRLIDIRKYPIKKNKLSINTISLLKQNGWKPPFFSV